MSEWISVKDDLPKPPNKEDLDYYLPRYLVCVDDGPRTVTDGRIVEPVIISKFYGGDYFGGWQWDYITHWMPLPKRSKEPA